MPPKKILLKETTSTTKDFDNTHTTSATTSPSVEQQLNKIMELTSTTNETVKNLEHKFTKANESIEQTNIALKNLQQSIKENYTELRVDLHSVDVKASKAFTKAQANKTQIEKILQTQASLEEHIQSVLESKIQTLLVKERDQNKTEIFALSNKLNKLEDENNDLRNRSMRSTLIFRGILEEEQNDSWENVMKYLVNTLVKKGQVKNLETSEISETIFRDF